MVYLSQVERSLPFLPFDLTNTMTVRLSLALTVIVLTFRGIRANSSDHIAYSFIYLFL